MGRFRVLGRLGGGGQAEVFRAYDPELHCERALKVLPETLAADPEARARLLREARLASRLRHHHICGIYDIGEHAGRLYVVMELVEGQTLRDRLGQGPLAPEAAAAVGAQVADALAYAHAHGVVHRDLSSANVMLTPDGHAMVLDFGLARALPGDLGRTLSTVTASGVVLGTPDYVAPEVLKGSPADARSDVWTLGVLLHEMLSGTPPFRRRALTETLAAVLQDPPPPLPARTPRAWNTLLSQCLDKDPARRPASAADVKLSLERVRSAAPDAWIRARHPARAVRWIAVVMGSVAVVVAAWWWIHHAGPAPVPSGVQALAVLPLENVSGDVAQQYLADGMTDELITTLAQISALRVTSRSSVMRYRAQPPTIADVARDLRVQDVIEGSVMRAGDHIRVTARLIGAATDQPLWAETYVRPIRDVLALQNDLARTIADQVRIRLTPAEARRLSVHRTVAPDVYALCLRGRIAWNRLDAPGLREAESCFQQAIARDSAYAPAWAGLSDAYWGASSWFEAPNVVMPKAIMAARHAIAVDDSCADGHASLGTALLEYAWDWSGAERELRRAVALNRSHAAAHRELAFLMRIRGRYDEDRSEVEQSVELDPLSAPTVTQQGWPEFFGHRYLEAVRTFERSILEFPDAEAAHGGLGLALEQQRDYPRAIAELRRAFQLAPVSEMGAALAHAYAAAGEPQRARALLDSLEHHVGVSYVGPSYLAIVYVALGNRAKALDLLEDGFRSRDEWMTWLKVDPRFDPLRSDPRFQSLVAKMGL